jgi:uncharacterized protein YndB with AHSA1/START domain
MTPLPNRLDRTVTIQASRETIFGFFTDDARWASWWGAGSTIEARPGGRIRIQYPDGTKASGEVLDVLVPDHLVFTMGFDSGKPIPPGSSRVTLRLEAVGSETRLHLTHEFPDATVRDEFVQGWRYQLALFANLVANHAHAGSPTIVDAWLGAWSEPNEETRHATFAHIASPDVRFRDRFSLTDGTADLVAHTGAAQRFMPGLSLKRQGDVRHCQGMVLVDWIAVASDGQERGSGTNVFVFGAGGLIESVTGFWNPSGAK